jgi:hypothetical protein
MNLPRSVRRLGAAGLLVFSSVAVVAPSVASAQQAAPAKHHSKIKGAIVGAVAGKAAGGHTKMGAIAGAMVQHHRNKKSGGK